MTLLSGWFQGDAVKTTLTLRDDIITSDRLLTDSGSLWGGIALDGDYTATYEEIARKQLWVRIAINKLAYSLGRVTPKIYTLDGDSKVYTSSGSLADLIRNPNTTKATGTTRQFVAKATYDLFTYANSLIVKTQTRPDAPVVGMEPYSPLNWRVDGDTYIHRNPRDNSETRVPSWRMIHIIEPGPTQNGFGVSRLEAARLTLAIEYAAQKLGAATFANGARPGGIINVRNLPAGKERQAAVERFKAEVMSRFGGPSRAGLPAVLEGETSWMPMTHNLDDSAVVAHRQLTREEVAALFDIPQPAMGILNESNFASVDAFHVWLYQDTLGWPASLIESVLNSQLVRGVSAYQDQHIEFDLDTLMRGAYTERMAGHQTAINAGIRTRDEVRRLENLPPMADKQPEADLLTFPLNFGVAPSPPGKPAMPGAP
jgi:HK97 family phage portal protein